MTESVLCYEFHCKTAWCPAPIMLPIDTFERIFPYRGMSANDDHSVVLICDPCKHANIYSPDESSLYYDPKMERVLWVPGAVPEILLPLECAGANREFRIALVVTWNEGRTVQEKSEIAKTWIGGHLECPNRHPIHWPWRQIDDSRPVVD